MPARQLCPSMGSLSRSIVPDLVAVSKCSSRTFHVSVRRLDDKAAGASKAPTASPNQREPRRARMANATDQISNLQFRRPFPRNTGPLRSAPNGRSTQEGDRAAEDGTKPQSLKILTPKKPLNPRGAAPSGTMIRAPSKLRTNRGQAGSIQKGPRGPNLRGRGDSNSGVKESTPKRRDRKAGGQTVGTASQNAEATADEAMSDGLTQHLLRLQRKEWDRVPYKPMYAPGSFEANELIHTGRELFRGEAPPVKVWGRMEKTIGVVGMHGAEAHLEVTRVKSRYRGVKSRFAGKQKDASKDVSQVADSSLGPRTSQARSSPKVEA